MADRKHPCDALDAAIEALIHALPGRETMEAMEALKRAWERHRESRDDG